MLSKTEKNIPINNLTYLPPFAAYLLHERLDDFVQEYHRICQEHHLSPRTPDEKVKKTSIKEIKQFLDCLSHNKAKDLIRSMVANQKLYKEKSKPANVTVYSLVRKKALLHFLSDYETDVKSAINIVQEIDIFHAALEKASLQFTLHSIQQQLHEEASFNKKITDASPSIIYILSFTDNLLKYLNAKGEQFFGYNLQEFNALDNETRSALVHPEDREEAISAQLRMKEARDGEMRSVEYRLKNKQGVFSWVRNFMSVFKRDKEQNVVEIIGYLRDIEEQKEAQSQLEKNRQELLEAQEIAQLGSYIWYFDNSNSQMSPQCRKILEVEANDTDGFWKHVHPDDKQKVNDAIEKALKETGILECEYRYLGREKEKVVWTRGLVNYDNDKPVSISGTLIDVTERHHLMKQLQLTNKLHNQAQAIAHLGHYMLDIEKNTSEVTEEIYRIFGVNPEERKITPNDFRKFRHPDDNKRIDELIKKSFRDGGKMDYYYRIVLEDGTIKSLHSMSEVIFDTNGKPRQLVGIIQDVTDQSRLTQKLKQSEALYKQTEALAHLGSWSQNLRTGEVHWSNELYRILGIPVLPEPIPFEDFSEFIHPKDQKIYKEKFSKAIQAQEPFQLEFRILAKDETLKTLLVRTEVQIDADGKTCGLFGFVQDITEIKEAETRLNESRNLVQKITNTAPTIIALYNAHTGKHLFVTEGIKKLLGFEPEDVLKGGLDFMFSLIHPQEKQHNWQGFKEVLEQINLAGQQGNSNYVFENTYRIRHKNGQWRWFTTYTTIFDRNAEGKAEHLLNISLDVTAQKDAEKNLKEQQQFVQHIADASPTILYLFDVRKNSITYVNREIFFVLGYMPEEIIEWGSQVTHTLYHPDDFNLLPERKQSTKRIKETDIMLQYECRMKNKENEWQWFLVREVVFKTDEEGKVAEIVGAALDITKRKEMERTLLQNSFKLEQSNASLEEFAYVASHDLKEPLRKISTFGDRLVASHLDKMSADGKIYLKKIVDASQRMQTMISDLLSISLISSNKSYEPYSLQAILEEMLQTLEHKIEQRNALITSDKLPEANIIPSQFRQLFQNLLSNSLKFTKEGVQPVITIKHRYLSPEEVAEIGGTGNFLKIEFTDNGIGFEMEYAGKIFAIFQRLHGRSEYEGSGIGLAICKKIVEHHGGLIYATGIPDKGASFIIILPE